MCAIRFIRESRSFRVIGNVLRRERALLLSAGALMALWAFPVQGFSQVRRPVQAVRTSS